MSEENLNPQQSIHLIEQMIKKAKGGYYATGTGPILWGCVVSVCALVTWAQIHFQFQLPFDIWMLTFIAVAPQIYISIRERKMRKVLHYEDAAMGYIWGVFGFSIFLLIFINSFIFNDLDTAHKALAAAGKEDLLTFRYSDYMSSFFLLLYGIPTIITGGIMKFKPMVLGGMLCWLLCVAAVFTKGDTDMLLVALAAVCAWLVPGIILRKRYLQKKAVHV